MTLVDLELATRRLTELIRGAPDDALDRPTPCPDYGRAFPVTWRSWRRRGVIRRHGPG